MLLASNRGVPGEQTPSQGIAICTLDESPGLIATARNRHCTQVLHIHCKLKEGKFRPSTRKKFGFLLNKGSEALEQAAQRGGRCPIRLDGALSTLQDQSGLHLIKKQPAILTSLKKQNPKVEQRAAKAPFPRDFQKKCHESRCPGHPANSPHSFHLKQHSTTHCNQAEHQLQRYLLNHAFRVLHLIPLQCT